jgi:hypothetical protein
MRNTFSSCSFAVLLLGATLAVAPAAAQTGQVTAPKPKPTEIICSGGLLLCGCLGADDCDILKKFADAGGCSNRRCTDGTPQICTCDLAPMVAGNSPVLTAARRHNLVKPNRLDKITAPTRPVKDCKATATCGNTTVSCSVKGDGACQGVNGSGVSCTEFLSNGGQTTTTSPCGG